jgi:D-inositol-3-phosphate glycosyltransferase
MRRVAILSLHTSPLAQPGVGDGGGMNVYVRELVSALAHAGIDCTTYTRAHSADLPREIIVEPNHKVVHIPAGAVDMPKDNMFDIVPDFTDGVLQHINASGGTDIIHAN